MDARTLRKERFAFARAERALSLKLGKARIALLRLRRIGSKLARDPRNSHIQKSGISVLDVFQAASVLLHKHYDFCCSHPEQLPIFFEMHDEAMKRLGPAAEISEAIL